MNYQHKSSRSLRLLRLKAAFTLVELMVVLAIIAGLLLLIVPNVRKQRARARSAQCQNNLRQFGVAMNQYMADAQGYFVYPGPRGRSQSSAPTDHTIHIGVYEDGVVRRGGIAGATRHNWRNIMSYIPDPNVRNVDFIRSGQSSVRICPEVNRNAFVPGHQNFKGFRDETRDNIDVAEADFEHSYLKLDAEDYDSSQDDEMEEPELGKIVFESQFTTYGINRIYSISTTPRRAGPYQRSRGGIPDNIVAFICWNAEEGWGANVSRESTWAFNGQDRYGNPVQQGESKFELKGTTNWWHTEVGFYHPGIGTNMTANYVAMDGSVGSISYADISVTNFTWIE